ncbi:MAG: hypothetical protein CV089_18620 [Nitrospira sp. WS110]|nr:hypothetical protein [Nitrospira sp. WS110]
MTKYVVTRLLSAVPVLFLVSLVSFFGIRVLPGDLAEARLGEGATPQDVALEVKTMIWDRAPN